MFQVIFPLLKSTVLQCKSEKLH